MNFQTKFIGTIFRKAIYFIIMNLRTTAITIITVHTLLTQTTTAMLSSGKPQLTRYHGPQTIVWKIPMDNPDSARLSIIHFFFFSTMYTTKYFTDETLDYLQTLIDDGVDINRPFQGQSTTALEWAINKEKYSLINFLFRNGAQLPENV